MADQQGSDTVDASRLTLKTHAVAEPPSTDEVWFTVSLGCTPSQRWSGIFASLVGEQAASWMKLSNPPLRFKSSVDQLQPRIEELNALITRTNDRVVHERAAAEASEYHKEELLKSAAAKLKELGFK
jgi:hypothetical protein